MAAYYLISAVALCLESHASAIFHR